METLVKINEWGPVFFGVLIFGPMWSAALNAANITLASGVSNLALLMVAGGLWGLVAKIRGRWI